MQNNTSKKIDIGSLTGKLQTEDQRYANIAKRMQIVYWVLIPVYMIFIVRLILDGNSTSEIIGGVCFMLAMLTFAFSFKKLQKDYNNVDYSLPTLLMLEQAVKRYKPFQLKTFWAFLAAAFVDAGLVFNRPESENKWFIQFVFLGAIVIAIFVGLLIWRKRYKPLRDEALKLIEQLKS